MSGANSGHEVPSAVEILERSGLFFFRAARPRIGASAMVIDGNDDLRELVNHGLLSSYPRS
jgi:hypothetical protein